MPLDIQTTTQAANTSRTDMKAGNMYNKFRNRGADTICDSLDEMYDKSLRHAQLARTRVATNRQLELHADPTFQDKESLQLIAKGSGNAIGFNNWSFNQFCQRNNAPAKFFREKLPAQLIADNLNYLLLTNELDEMQTYVQLDESGNPVTLQAATGAKYGRIYNHQILSGVKKYLDTSIWGAPLGPNGQPLPCYFISDRDMFLFMANTNKSVQVNNRRNGQAGQLSAGIYAWNSEVGAQTAGFAHFLYDSVCGNRWVFGQRDYQEVRIRHTAKAQDRFVEEMLPAITVLADPNLSMIDAQVKAAQEKKVDDVETFLKKRYGANNAAKYQLAFENDEHREMESLWDIGTGITAFARTIKNNDERVKVESEAGKLLELAIK